MRLFYALVLLLCLPATASAAQVSLTLQTGDGVRYGAAHVVSGRLTEGGAGLAGQAVVLEARAHPYRGPFRETADGTTDASGRFTFRHAFERNAELRVSAPALGARSDDVRAFVFPHVRLSFEQLGPRRIRLTQSYRTPKGTRLTSPTIFYVGPRSERTAPEVARVKPRRRAPGRFTSSATVRVPREWRGRFRYASCFRYSQGTGLGDPRVGCPRRYRF